MPHVPPKPDAALVGVTLREDVKPSDPDAIRKLVEATGFFRPDEVEVAVELVEERMAKRVRSGYEFLLAEHRGMVIGFACYGPIACTLGSFDLYWIAVDPEWQQQGLGRMLLGKVEQRILEAGGRHIYIETSGGDQYAPTRTFYARCGYDIVATLPEFYDHGDDKVIWRKVCQPLA